MKANLQDQMRLLELVELDLSLTRNATEKTKLLAGGEIQLASEESLQLSDKLIDARNRVGELELELKRSENDLELVENRIAKDQQRLATTSSPKDAQGIEHELTSLARRKDELETLELGTLEELEVVRKELELVVTQKAQAESKLSALRDGQAKSSAELEAQKNDLLAKRKLLVATLDPELAQAYQRKSERGVAVGKLVARECGACRLSITATNLEEIMALPADEVAECPNCQAYLVRA